MTQQSTTKIHFWTFPFRAPETPSSVQNMKGVEWYLCMEADGGVTFKHRSVVERNDYLLAEMKSNEEFELTPGKTTFLETGFNNFS
uniref:Uncharacterized protein n=1 Tax=Panagrolaimus superbus TaxID=310955 RepID=A0A914Z1U1_9BILA